MFCNNSVPTIELLYHLFGRVQIRLRHRLIAAQVTYVHVSLRLSGCYCSKTKECGRAELFCIRCSIRCSSLLRAGHSADEWMLFCSVLWPIGLTCSESIRWQCHERWTRSTVKSILLVRVSLSGQLFSITGIEPIAENVDCM